jgi:methylated-DNA-protein-cysteine methyltransferase-like protein
MKSPSERIVAVLRRIPKGKVVTYGQVAELAGVPRAPRLVVQTLHRCGDEVPWHRVIGKRGASVGGVSIKDPLGAKVQRRLLEKEGVKFDRAGGVDLDRFGWHATNSITIR